MSRAIDPSDDAVQAKVRLVVDWYKKGFPDEYKAFVAQTRLARDEAANEFGAADFKHSETRQIHDIPENMFKQLVMVLSPEELKDFTTKSKSIWFAKTFPQFALAREF